MEWHEGYEIVAEGGRAVARLLPRPPCPYCDDTGVREVDIRGARRVGKCRCRRLPDRIALWNHAGVPARHAGCTMETFDRDLDGSRIGWTYTRAWLDDYRPGLTQRGFVLEGKPGRGKTHLLCGVVRELIFRHGVSVRFVEFTHLLAQLREGIGRDDPTATALTPLVNVPVLAIDELGKGRKTDWESAVVDEIVTRRYNTGGILVGTTNFPSKPEAPPRARDTLAVAGSESLGERLGERVFSRLAETVKFFPVKGEDFRMMKK
ncbi:MAG: ATP-binding protein [Myxococcota bacterium]